MMIVSILFLLATFGSTYFFMVIARGFAPMWIFALLCGLSAVYASEMFARNALHWPEFLGGLIAVAILVAISIFESRERRQGKI